MECFGQAVEHLCRQSPCDIQTLGFTGYGCARGLADGGYKNLVV